MKIVRESTLSNGNGAHGWREVHLEGPSLRRLVARYPEGDRLDVQNGKEGQVVLTVVPPFQRQTPRYAEIASDLAPLHVSDERVDGDQRTVELTPRQNRIQRFNYVQAVIPATSRLEVEAGYGGNPFSVGFRVV